VVCVSSVLLFVFIVRVVRLTTIIAIYVATKTLALICGRYLYRRLVSVCKTKKKKKKKTPPQKKKKKQKKHKD
jgi:hypothetical protein